MQHKHTAQGLASLGRGPDTELVHMTKGEVHGLQKLAMAHGGSLTINPQTGLPEAGFLSSILPMAAGFALGPAGFGLMSSAMAGLTVGGVSALASKSLKKGLMAGLGAYGGAGLGESLMRAGTGALSSAAGATVPDVAAGAGAAIPDVATNTVVASPVTAGVANPVSLDLSQTYPGALEASNAATSSFVPTTTQAPSLAEYLAQDQAAADAVSKKLAASSPMDKLSAGFKDVTSSGAKALAFAKNNAYPLGAMGLSALGSMGPTKLNAPPVSTGMIRPYTFERTQNEVPDALTGRYVPGQSTRERDYFKDRYTAGTPYKAPGPEYMADGGEVAAYKYDPITQTYSSGVSDSAGEVSDSAGEVSDSVGGYTFNPLTGTYGRSPTRALPPAAQAYYSSYSDGSPGDSGGGGGGGDDGSVLAQGGIIALAQGGGSNLGGYSDGGQLLRGPGDGVSDSIPAMIGQKQQARLADGEFVVPARIVSELGNGSTQAGARQLYAMMDRVQNARKKSVGKDKVATNTKARTLLPA